MRLVMQYALLVLLVCLPPQLALRLVLNASLVRQLTIKLDHLVALCAPMVAAHWLALLFAHRVCLVLTLIVPPVVRLALFARLVLTLTLVS